MFYTEKCVCQLGSASDDMWTETNVSKLLSKADQKVTLKNILTNMVTEGETSGNIMTLNQKFTEYNQKYPSGQKHRNLQEK